jgi:hypothetical protein
MDRDIGAPVRRRRHRRAHFILGVLGDVERVEVGRDAAAGHDLDLACSLHQLFAHPAEHLRDAIGNCGVTIAFGGVQGRRIGAREIGNKPEIAVSGGLRDGGATEPDSRPGDEALVDGALEAEGRSAEVAHRSETALQHLFGGAPGAQRAVVGICRHHQRNGQRRHGHVHMGIDEARHERAAAAVDDRRARAG